MHEVTVTHTIQLPDGYELAPGPQPRVPTEEDLNAGCSLLIGPFASATPSACLLKSTEYIHKYFIIHHKPIGVKLVFVDVRKFKDIPVNGSYHGLAGGEKAVSYTAIKANTNAVYSHESCEALVAYYTVEPIYAPAS